MDFIPSLFFDTVSYLQWPGNFLGWAGWFLFLAGILYLAWRWKVHQKPLENRDWAILNVLFASEILATLFIGFHLSPGNALPAPGVLATPSGSRWMVLAGIPWVLAAGLQGPFAAMGLAGLSGLLLALWDTHSVFTPMEYAVMGLLVGVAMSQKYRTATFKAFRHPLVVGLLISFGYPVVFVLDEVLATEGALPVVLDFALTHVKNVTLVVAGTLIVGGIVGEVIAIGLPKSWGRRGPLQPSPSEKSLETRSFYVLGPMVALVSVLLTVFGWNIASRASQNLILDRMGSTTRLAAENIPFALEVGQNLILQFASDPVLSSGDMSELEGVLLQQLRASPYFNQLMVLDSDLQVLADVPSLNSEDNTFTPREAAGIDLAFEGVVFQYYTIPPAVNGNSAQVSFIASVFGNKGQVVRVLVGRSELSTNPFTSPIINSLDSLKDVGGEGILIDENGAILYHQNPNLVMSKYTGRVTKEASFFNELSPEGTRDLVYFQPAVGRSWAVVEKVSAQEVQRLALIIAAPLLSLLFLLSLFLMVLLRLVLRLVTASLRSLAVDADRIAQDQAELGSPLLVEGVDEVGKLRRAFERMRVSLKSRLDEQEQLLKVSKGVASSLEMETAVQPILQAALAIGPVSARVVLASNALPELDEETPTRFGAGAEVEKYQQLDPQILHLNSQQPALVLRNPARARLLRLDDQRPVPEALLAMALRHENIYYGSLWVAYDQPHLFEEDEIRFLTTLAGQAAIAAANARLFLTAEIGRQRLAVILSSTPDPVLVTDHHNRLLLANPAAWQVFSNGLEPARGVPIDKIVSEPEVLDLLTSLDDDLQNKEITFHDKRVFYATVTTVHADGKGVGKVCVFRDVTNFKELDTLKSEFVATVSHDLRSPLTLMHGYATMLQMVGELNEQQAGYVRKIVAGVENMSRLVNNLLDLGRIEAGVDLRLELVPVIDILDRVRNALQLQAAQKRLDLTVETPEEGLPLIEADQALFEQAIQNLVENAIKYTGPGGKVCVDVEYDQKEGTILIQVRDTGIGVAPVDQPRLFEKFFRSANRESRKVRGSGLGLAIVKSIAERHKGRVWLESQLGKGSTFFFSIPIRQPPAEE